MNIKDLAEKTSGPVRAALLALEAKVMMLQHDLAEERAKNDPLADVLKDFGGFMPDADDFRAALDARGFEIRGKANDD